MSLMQVANIDYDKEIFVTWSESERAADCRIDRDRYTSVNW